ncbi:hypothetical protein MRS44_016024 [Fusarium solani]|uniref:uncharacterized protein n=1 Tax=Fusarium solani TaxID=169388 RepID=UPI0032C46524|nr:hypothetical protein MRS44_016024 [Fusarium solani]
MGFWGSLVDGVKSAGGWVLDHSGDIASAVGTVAKIAGTFAIAADSEDEAAKMAAHQRHLKEFYRNFDIASGRLEKAAKKASKQASEDAAGVRSIIIGDGLAAEKPIKDSFTGIWKNPSALLPDGTPAVPMYQDLSKWIGALGVPPSQSVDVASVVGKALFANDNSSVSLDEAKIHTTQFAYTDPKGKWTLDLGNACIYGKFQPSKSFKAEMQAEGAPSSAIFVSELKAGDKPVWVVNASINWGNASLACGVHSKLVDTLKKDYKNQGRSVLSSKLTGVMQVVQIASEYTAGQPTDPGEGSDTSDTDSSGDSSADEMNGDHDAVKNGTNKPSKAKRTAVLARAKPTASGMPLIVPEVNITKSQIVFK